jgi:hypothetical protein
MTSDCGGLYGVLEHLAHGCERQAEMPGHLSWCGPGQQGGPDCLTLALLEDGRTLF